MDPEIFLSRYLLTNLRYILLSVTYTFRQMRLHKFQLLFLVIAESLMFYLFNEELIISLKRTIFARAIVLDKIF